MNQCAIAKYKFKSAPGEDLESDVRMLVSGKVVADRKRVTFTLDHLGCHSVPFHKSPDREWGPAPTAVSFEARAVSGTTGFPRCYKGPDPVSIDAGAEEKQTREAGLQGLQASPAHVDVKGGGKTGHEESGHSSQSCDKIRWSAGLDGDIAQYFGSIPLWSDPTNLKRHPDVPRADTRYKKWRQLYDNPLANGFCHPDMKHVIEWDRSPKFEPVEIEIILKAQVGVMRCAGRWFRRKKFFWKCKVIEAEEYIAKKDT